MDIMDLLESVIAIKTRANRGFLKIYRKFLSICGVQCLTKQISLNAVDILFNDFLDLHLNWFILMHNKFNNKEVLVAKVKEHYKCYQFLQYFLLKKQ